MLEHARHRRGLNPFLKAVYLKRIEFCPGFDYQPVVLTDILSVSLTYSDVCKYS
jgi:hypothetical protein